MRERVYGASGIQGRDAVRLSSFESIARELQKAGVRYVVVGGLAVNAHGYHRMTSDVDIVIQLVPENIHLFFNAVDMLGYRPSVPVTVRQVADVKQRQGWVVDKGMTVLNFWSSAHPETTIDVFVTEPFDFDAEYSGGVVKSLYPGLDVHFASIATLIRMKETAGRAKDMIDIEYLKKLDQQGRVDSGSSQAVSL